MALSRSHRKGPEAVHYQSTANQVWGADEVGRGALAGPLTVALVGFPPEVFGKPLPKALRAVTDSKQLAAATRQELVPHITRAAAFWAVTHVSNRLVDRLGINPATRYALERLLERAGVSPGTCLVLDGKHSFHIERRFPALRLEMIVGGDAACLSIAAASILAKESRDQRMRRMAHYFPQYGFERHKGYGTHEHRAALAAGGPCALHRRSFLLEESTQLEFAW